MENQYNLTTKQTIGVFTILALSLLAISLFSTFSELPLLQAGI